MNEVITFTFQISVLSLIGLGILGGIIISVVVSFLLRNRTQIVEYINERV